MKRDNERFEIDTKKILTEIWKNMAIILLSGLAAALAAMLLSVTLLPRQYESTTKMYVLAKQESGTVTNGDMEASTALTRDYQELIQSRTVIEQVIVKLQLDIEYEDLLKKLTILAPSETRVIYITVSDEDPYLAAEIADEVREVSAQHIQKVMSTQSVNVVDYANIPDTPAGVGSVKYALLADIVAVFLVLVTVTVKGLVNDKIKSTEDVERYLNISTLGMIPAINKKIGKKK